MKHHFRPFCSTFKKILMNRCSLFWSLRAQSSIPREESGALGKEKYVNSVDGNAWLWGLHYLCEWHSRWILNSLNVGAKISRRKFRIKIDLPPSLGGIVANDVIMIAIVTKALLLSWSDYTCQDCSRSHNQMWCTFSQPHPCGLPSVVQVWGVQVLTGERRTGSAH
jgi:hypothetical protein